MTIGDVDSNPANNVATPLLRYQRSAVSVFVDSPLALAILTMAVAGSMFFRALMVR